MIAEERRDKGQREKLYVKEAISAEITYDNKTSITTHIIDISNDGLGVLGPIDAPVPSTTTFVTVHIFFTKSSRSKAIQARIVNSKLCTYGETQYKRLSLTFLNCVQNFHSEIDYKNSVKSSKTILPICYFNNPLLFSSTIHGSVIEFFNNGLRIKCSASNKAIYPGFSVILSVMFPLTGECLIKSTIENTLYIKEQDSLLIDLGFKSENSKFMAAITDYLISFCEASPIALKECGYFLSAGLTSVKLTYPVSKEDLDQALQIRLQSYQKVGKMTALKDPVDTLDVFDSYSRIIIAKIGSKVIGTGRVVFCEKDDRKSEHLSLGLTLPKWLKKSGFAECSRFAVDINFQGSDVFLSLLRKCALVAITSQTRYLLANCNPDLWPLYKKLGFQKLGITFEAFGRTDCELIYMDLHKNRKASRGNSIVWNQVFFPVVDYSKELYEDFSLFSKFKIFIHAMLHKKISDFARERKFKKFIQLKKSKKSGPPESEKAR